MWHYKCLKKIHIYQFLISGVLLTTSAWALGTPKNPIQQLSINVIKNNAYVVNKQILLALNVVIPKGWILELMRPPSLTATSKHNIKKLSLGIVPSHPYTISGLKVNGYKNHVLFPVLIQLKKQTPINTILILQGTLCRNVCFLFKKSVLLTIPVGGNVPTSHQILIARLAIQTQLLSPKSSPIPVNHVTPSKTKNSLPYSIIWAFLFAFLIGLMLNIFPCILPALAFKIQSSKNKKLVAEKWIFAAGALSSFILLGMVVGVLKNTFFWGIQFQSPWALFTLATLFLGFGLLSFSHFKIGFLESKFFHTNQLFFGGLLSVFIGISCSVPLLGSLLILAFSFSFFAIVALFFTMGIGFILPYLTIIAPILQKIFNTYPTLSKKIKYITGGIFFVFSGILFGLGIFSLLKPANSAKEKIQHIPVAMTQYHKVLVDVSADWCITCQINHIYLKNIQDFLAKNKFLVITLDYTKPNKAIQAYLKKYNSAALPTFVYYSNICKKGKKLNIVFLSKKILTQSC